MVPDLDTFPGTVSVWCGPLDGPARFAREEHVPHYAASTMKVGVMVAAFRAFPDLDRPVLVHNRHRSALPGAPDFGNDADNDGDPEVWQRMDHKVPLGWLVTRMIIRSSNLATNLVLGALDWDFDAVNQVWRDAGAVNARTRRGIDDAAARQSGVQNEVTAADLAALMSALALGRLAGQAATAEMLEILCGQLWREDFLRGLPEGTRAAVKNGWITGVRHSAGVVFPEDAPPYALAVCTTGPADDTAACDLLARVAEASWRQRL